MKKRRIVTNNKIIVCLLFLISGLFILFPFPLCADQNDSTDKMDAMGIIYHELDNGLPYFIQKRDAIALVNFVFVVNLGPKDEDATISGLSHILEHCIFQGESELHSTREINLDMRRHGGYFNAHTSNDTMSFELTLPASHWEYGIDFLKEKLFHLKLSQEFLDNEKKVIFEEISQHFDNAYKLSALLTMVNLFPGHPYEHPIAGTPDVINNASIATIESFYKKYFTPSNCALAVVGDIIPKEVETKLQQVFGKLEKSIPPSTQFQVASSLKKDIRIDKEMDLNQAHLVFAFMAPPSGHPDQLAFTVLNQILGKGINPLLRSILIVRGQRLVSEVFTNYIPLQYGGVFMIHLTLDPKNIRAAERELIKFLTNAWKYPFSPPKIQSDDLSAALQMDYLENAKSNMKYAYQEFLELGQNLAFNSAQYILFNKNKHSLNSENNSNDKKPESYMSKLNKISSTNIQTLVSQYLSGKKYVTITILPLNKNNTPSTAGESE